jgi:carotenoid cleavage dioxygenase-like enzyme
MNGNSDLDLKRMEVIGTLKPRWRSAPSYYHSFAITEHYIVFIEQTLVLDIPRLLVCGLTRHSYLECMRFHKHEKV